MDNLCAVCGEGTPEMETFLCNTCIHEHRIRTYCRRCHKRLDLSPIGVQRFFPGLWEQLGRTGVALRLEACPLCSDDEHTYHIVRFDLATEDQLPLQPNSG